MPMTRAATALPVVALVWAEVTVGGSLMAAPSKFQTVSLTLAQTGMPAPTGTM